MPSTDKPSTTGFICHTCVWRERSESHELMDLTTLVGHAQRYHYLQPSQITDYRKFTFPNTKLSLTDPVKSAYCVTRDPKLVIGAGQVHFERLHKKIKSIDGIEASSFREVRVLETVEVDAGPTPYLSALKQQIALDTKRSKSVDSAELGHHKRKSSGFLSSMMSGEKWTSQKFATRSPPLFPVPQRYEDRQILEFTVSSMMGDAQKLPSVDASPASKLEDIFDEDDIALSIFDYEISCQPYFDTQLQEYMETYGITGDGIDLNFSADDMVKMPRGRDRLPVWPEKVKPDFIEAHFELEEQDEIIEVSAIDVKFEDSGEAAEYMDMRDKEDYM